MKRKEGTKKKEEGAAGDDDGERLVAGSKARGGVAGDRPVHGTVSYLLFSLLCSSSFFALFFFFFTLGWVLD